MTFRAAFSFLTVIGLALPLINADAQTPYSPASPVNTTSPYAGVALPRTTSAAPTRPVQAQPGQPVTGLSIVPGGYVAASQVLTSEPIDPNHKLGRADRLSYRVTEDRDSNVYTLLVGDDGSVELPLGGRIKAAGKSTDQLRADIKSLLEKEYYYHATVSLGLDAVAQRASRGRIYVTGAVRTTGPVELPVDAPMTASQAIYQMGGPVDFSNMKRTRVMRKGGPKDGIPVNIKAVEKGELDKDVVLEPGDTVIVPVAGFGVRF